MNDVSLLEIFVAPTIEAFATVALPPDPLFHVRLVRGEAIDGLVVVLRGAALAGFDVSALEVWVPYGDPAARWEIVPQEDEGGGLRFELPAVHLEASASPLHVEDFSNLPVEVLEARLFEENRQSLAGAIRGRARGPLESALEVQVRGIEATAPSSLWREAIVLIDPLPREPVVPASSRGREGEISQDPDAERNATLSLWDAHSGSDYGIAWFGFDDATLATAACFQGWVDRLVVALLDAVEEPFLVASLLQPGGGWRERPRRLAELADREGIKGGAWAEVWTSLAAGAALRLDVAQEGHDPSSGYLWVRNAQLGDPLARSGTAPFPLPLEILVVLPQPEPDRLCVALTDALRGVLDDVVEHEACLGALVTAQGIAQRAEMPLPYEILAGVSDAPLDVALRARPRVPGWRVLVPSVAASRIAKVDLMRRRPVAAGILVGSEAPDPFSMDAEDREALERALIACFQ